MTEAENKRALSPVARDADAGYGSVSSDEGNNFWSRLKGGARLEVEPSSYAPPGTHWSNKDLDPVPPEQQTWKTVCHCLSTKGF